MTEQPDTKAATLPWRTATAGLVGAGASTALQRSLILLNATGLLAGYFLMYTHWVQLAWMGVLVTAWAWAGGAAGTFFEGLRADRWLMALCGTVFVMMVRSSVLHSPGAMMADLWSGWLGAALLLVFLATLWQAGRSVRRTRTLGLPTVAAAALAAVVSLVVFYRLHPEGMFGMRLRNWLVYGGLNSVCTGLMFGFAATWAANAWNHATERRERLLWLALLLPLMAATLFTLSRGALLALLSGHAALLAVSGWRRAWRPCALLVVMVGLFQLCAPLLADLAAHDASQRLGIEDKARALELVGDGVVPARPAQMMMERADNGRMLIYGGALGSMTTWQDWVFGKGLWSANDAWSCSLHWYPEHMHSVFLAALVHTGMPGLLAVLVLLGWGLWRALRLAQMGEDLWIMLAAFGIAGVTFDGQSLFSLLTLPRYEPLLVWVPLVLASSRLQALSR